MTKKVLMISSECTPFVKTGGLADVVGTLPKVLKKQGVDCRVVLPLYKQIKDRYSSDLQFLAWTNFRMGWRSQYVGLFTLELSDVRYYFIDNEFYFGSDQIYIDYSYDIERYSYFQRAVLAVLGEKMDFTPDILHCHDWQSGMVPCLLHAHFKSHGYFTEMKTIYTIHNLKYQGVHGYDQIADFLDLSSEYLNDYGAMKNAAVNFMKAGIVYSDYMTTVSPTYANEILSPYYGEGLEHVLQHFAYKMRGIVNGIDLEEWNPASDPFIDEPFTAITVEEKKHKNKLALQESLDLERNAEIPLITMVSRLVDQKGLDLLLHILDEMASLPCQIVILGTGDSQYENALREAENRNRRNLRSMIMYSNELSHRLYAAGDIFLMPSLFEPCGLSQMISMRYGNIPLVRETGGLKDTVKAFNTETFEGNGFSFPNINAHDLLFLSQFAVRLYHEDKKAWASLVKNAMESNFSWTKSAKEYKEVYDYL